jgi:hypothetical protein
MIEQALHEDRGIEQHGGQGKIGIIAIDEHNTRFALKFAHHVIRDVA